MNEVREPSHDCGVCNGKLRFHGMAGKHAMFVCQSCGWFHLDVDCCHAAYDEAKKRAIG